jgi:predicted XRE-type DNA-binding protein
MTSMVDADVIQIRGLKGAMRQREIADLYGVSRSLVSLIHSRKVWSHLAEQKFRTEGTNQ